MLDSTAQENDASLRSTSETNPNHTSVINLPGLNKSSSSTELCAGPALKPASGSNHVPRATKNDLDLAGNLSEDETEAIADLEELPRDATPTFVDGSDENRQFIENLMRDFDEDAFPEEGEAGNVPGVTSAGDTPLVTSANSRKAIQIIKENSEILEKILRKKGEGQGVHPERLQRSNTETEGQGHGRGQDEVSRRSSMASSSVFPRSASSTDEQGGMRTPLSQTSVISHDNQGQGQGQPFRRYSAASMSNGATKPITFNPFPTRPGASRRNKEVGRKLGLYSSVK